MSLPPIKLSSPSTKEFWEIGVVYEDEHLLAIDKPACLLTSPDRYDPDRPNLMRLLHSGIADGKPWAVARGLSYLSNAHRLDFETTGVLLLAKSKPVLVALANLFSTDKPRKVYAAIVEGAAPTPQFVVDAGLSPQASRPGLMRIDNKRGKRSRTEFEVEIAFRRYTLLICRPITGRTHQIRVHLQSVQLPICGDGVYGGSPLKLSSLKRRYSIREGEIERPLISTLALHAETLSLDHPVTGVPLEIHAPRPKTMRVAIKYLRQYGGL